MAKPMAEMWIHNKQHDRLRVLIKDEGEEHVLSRGEVAYVIAAGQGGHQPAFSIVMAEDSIEVSALHAESCLLFKEPSRSKNSGKQTSGVWDRELDGGS